MMADYRIIFFIGLSCFAFFAILAAGNGYQQRFAVILSALFAVFCIYLFGNRPVELYTDTYTYLAQLNRSKGEMDIGLPFVPSKDMGWELFVRALAGLQASGHVFFTFSACLFIVPLFCAFYRMFRSNMMLPFLLLCSCFFFWALGTNVLRTGIGLSFMLLGISFHKELRYELFFFALSILFHLSFILPVGAWLLFSYTQIKIEYVVGIWIFFMILAWLNIDGLNRLLQFVHASNVNDRISGYLTSNKVNYRTGFRFDFVAFSLFFGVAGYFLHTWLYTDKFYDTILKSYILINAFFLLTMNIPFSDRFAVLSWVLIPVICTYPLIKSDYLFWKQSTFLLAFCMFGLTFLITI